MAVRVAYVETGIGMAFDAGAAVWCFDDDLWGRCVQGPTEDAAIDAFTQAQGPVRVVECISGDERAFERDHVPATDRELELTLLTLAEQRVRSIGLATRLPDNVLDRDDPARVMPRWAHWRTIRDTLWHIADTESRYYLPRLEVPTRERAGTLVEELQASAAHVRRTLPALPRDRVVAGAETWTTTKLMRRLAWHERGELEAVGALLRRWRTPSA
jgi:hypothetical protein